MKMKAQSGTRKRVIGCCSIGRTLGCACNDGFSLPPLCHRTGWAFIFSFLPLSQAIAMPALSGITIILPTCKDFLFVPLRLASYLLPDD